MISLQKPQITFTSGTENIGVKYVSQEAAISAFSHVLNSICEETTRHVLTLLCRALFDGSLPLNAGLCVLRFRFTSSDLLGKFCLSVKLRAMNWTLVLLQTPH